MIFATFQNSSKEDKDLFTGLLFSVLLFRAKTIGMLSLATSTLTATISIKRFLVNSRDEIAIYLT